MDLSFGRRRALTALAVWFATRAVLYLIATGRLLHSYGEQSVRDVTTYAGWAGQSLSHGHIPPTTEWQYPPLLAPILLVPQWLNVHFGLRYLTGFTAITLLADAAITGVLLWTAVRRDTWSGAWYWIVGVPMLGPIVYGRYDVFPALCVVVALALLGQGVAGVGAGADGSPAGDLNRRRWAAGILVGLGTAIKIWPVLTIFGMPRTRRGWQAITTSLVAAAVSIASMALLFSGTTSWIGNQDGRGIEIESLWAMPWMVGKGLHLNHVVTDRVVYGSFQVEPGGHGSISTLIGLTADVALCSEVLAFCLMAYWWWRKSWRPSVVADSAFVATRLSPQL